jgi:hypothetical protein
MAHMTQVVGLSPSKTDAVATNDRFYRDCHTLDIT